MADKMAGLGEPTDTSLPSDADNNADTVVYPDYIPEKFRQGTVEEATEKMAQSYAELEKSRGKPEAKPDGDNKPDNKPDTADGEPAPISLKGATDEFIKNDGEISEATYEGLAKMGMTKELVDDYIAGQQAIAGQLVTRIHSIAGGEAEYSALMEWAGQNWSAEQVDAYDAVINAGDEGSITLALNGLKAAYTEAEGSAPNLLNGQSDGLTGPGGYASKAEMTADMKDPRYKTDPGFRKQVEAKLQNSNIWGARK
jgi:hypothetical protein